jgi:hypothetical protein
MTTRPANSTAIERAITLKPKWSILYRRALVARVASSRAARPIVDIEPMLRVCARSKLRYAKGFMIMFIDCLSQQDDVS